jgi:hypothetical protein
MNILSEACLQGIDLVRHGSQWSGVECVWYRAFLLWSESFVALGKRESRVMYVLQNVWCGVCVVRHQWRTCIYALGVRDFFATGRIL